MDLFYFAIAVVCFCYSDAFLNLADVECGINVVVRKAKIVGGTSAHRYEIPWAASIWRQGVHQCGATIISDRWLLTAGHCICSASNSFYISKQLRAMVGSYDLSDMENMQTESVSKIIPHPKYRCTGVKNDLALLKMNEVVKWSEVLKPACLPLTDAVNYSGYSATVAGWGWTDEDRVQGIRPDVLQKADVTVFSNEQCSQWYKTLGTGITVSDNQMCAGTEAGGRDACWADSGGPLIVHDENGRSLVAGVVSTGHGCARKELPGIYTRVSEYTSWIEDTIKSTDEKILKQLLLRIRF